jgi:TonB-linked SusC/RagA family outer membrane protein
MKKIILLLFVCFSGLLVYAQNKLEGVVTTASDRDPLPGVNIYNKTEGKGTISDVNGYYSIQATEGDSIIFSFIGMEHQVIVYSGQQLKNIQLKATAIELDELIMVGYSTVKKSVVTGAIGSVRSDDLEKTSNLRVEQALQGKTSGIQITSSSGQPGEAVTVRIRGTGTTGNANPLYIVDGIPSGGIDYLSPSDIESVEILKDAASASIYGARGANGVVLIQTKSGKAGRMQVNYNVYYGIQNPTHKVSLLNAEQYALIMNEAANNAGQKKPFGDPKQYGEGTDWLDEIIYHNAPIQEHQIGISGGNERSVYSSSFSYFNQDGIIGKGKSNYERYSFRLNTDQKSDKFVYGSRLYYSHIDKKGISPNQEYGQPLASALNIDPITPVKNDTGGWGVSPYLSQEIVNPLAQLETINQKYKMDKVVGNVFGELEIAKNLKIKSSFGVDFAYDLSENYIPVYVLNSSTRKDISSISNTMNRYFTWNWENTMSYNKIMGRHQFNGLIGYSMLEYNGQKLMGSKEGLITDDPNMAYIDMAKSEGSDKASGNAWQSALLSYFGQINYSYLEKYLITATVRVDGSSKFGPDNRFAVFPSVSAGWVLSKEYFFLAFKDKINFAKLRLSWGQNGNQEIGDYKYTSVITSNSNYYFGTPSNTKLYNGAQPANVPNPEIRWETSEQTDIGVDLRMYENRLSFTLDWYNKKTKGLLVEAPIVGYVGNNSPTINAGDVRNTGIELELGYKNNIGNFTYDINYNMSFNKNKVTYIGNAEGVIHGAGVATMSDICRAQEGYPIAYFYGYQTDGIFQNQAEINAYSIDGVLIQPKARPGDFKYIDNNGDGEITEQDRTMIGNPNPDVLLGFNLGAGYKGFDLNIFLQGAFGQQVFYGVRRNDLPNANYDTEILNRWLGEGSTNDYPRVTLNDQNLNFSRPSDYFVHDASYLRVKNVQIGYSFPIRAGDFVLIHKLRIYASAQNLLTFTKYKGFDPEIGARSNESYSTLDVGIDRGAYPQSKIYMIGASVNF